MLFATNFHLRQQASKTSLCGRSSPVFRFPTLSVSSRPLFHRLEGLFSSVTILPCLLLPPKQSDIVFVSMSGVDFTFQSSMLVTPRTWSRSRVHTSWVSRQNVVRCSQLQQMPWLLTSIATLFLLLAHLISSPLDREQK